MQLANSTSGGGVRGEGKDGQKIGKGNERKVMIIKMLFDSVDINWFVSIAFELCSEIYLVYYKQTVW